MIEVVTGILLRDERIFLQQRRGDDGHAPYRWETPGGKVESGEFHHAALRRELMEELGIELLSLDAEPYWSGTAGQDGNRGGAPVTLTAYLVRRWRPPSIARHARTKAASAAAACATPRAIICATCRPSGLVAREGQGTGWFTREQLLNLRGSLNYGNELMLDELARLLLPSSVSSPEPWDDGVDRRLSRHD